jgi:hypothetical protein
MNREEMRDVIQKWNKRRGYSVEAMDYFMILFSPMDPEATLPELLCWFLIVSRKLRQRVMRAFAQKFLISYLEPEWHYLTRLKFDATWLGAKDLLKEIGKNPDECQPDALTMFRQAIMMQYDLMEELDREVELAFKEADQKREAEIRQAMKAGMKTYMKGEKK